MGYFIGKVLSTRHMSCLLGRSPVCAEHHRVPALRSWLGQDPAPCAGTKVEVGQPAMRSEFAEEDASDKAADADQPDLGWKESVSEKQSPRTRPLRVKTAAVTVAFFFFFFFYSGFKILQPLPQTETLELCKYSTLFRCLPF